MVWASEADAIASGLSLLFFLGWAGFASEGLFDESQPTTQLGDSVSVETDKVSGTTRIPHLLEPVRASGFLLK